MRSEFAKDLNLLSLALTSPEELYEKFTELNNSEVDTALYYKVPLKEMMDKLIGTEWYLEGLSYRERMGYLAQHRAENVDAYISQFLELRKKLLGEVGIIERTDGRAERGSRGEIAKRLLYAGHSTVTINRVCDRKPFRHIVQGVDKGNKSNHNVAQQVIRKLMKEPSKYSLLIQHRERLLAPYVLKMTDLLNHLASYMNIYGISRYLGWDNGRVRRELQHRGIVAVAGRIYGESRENADRIGGGKWDYMIGRQWRNGTMRVLYPLGYRKHLEKGERGNIGVCLASKDVFTDDFYQSRYHVVYYRCKCDRCGYELNLAHQFIMNDGHCPVCLEKANARNGGRQPNLQKLGYKQDIDSDRTLLSKPPTPPYLDGTEPPEYSSLMKEAIACKGMV